MRENSPVDQAYSYIKKLIVTKTLYPGNRIVEEDISRETGISRTPIRTALLRLSYEGMVERQPNRGSFVAKPSMTDLDQVYELRVLLEVGAFRAAIRHRSEESVSWMRNVLDQQADLEKHFNMVEYASLNREFHWIIALEARNPYYEKYLNELHNKVSTYLLFWDSSTNGGRSLAIHQRIYEAFCDQDEERGVAALMDDIHLGQGDIRRSPHILAQALH